MSFRLATLLYLSALIGASLAAFGPWGLGVAACVIGSWVIFFHAPRTLISGLVAVAIVFLLLCLLLPAVQSARETSNRI